MPSEDMLDAAISSDADLVSGLCVRVHTGGRREREQPWMSWIYQHSRVLEDVGELPDLFAFDPKTQRLRRCTDGAVPAGKACVVFVHGMHGANNSLRDVCFICALFAS